MGRSIVVDFPHVVMEGEGTEIPGLGVFPNGTHEIHEDHVVTYVAFGNEWDDEDEVKKFGYTLEDPVVEEPGPAEPMPVEQDEDEDEDEDEEEGEE